MRKLSSFLICASIAAAVPAFGDAIPLLNADIETNSSGQFGRIDGWGPNGGWADHASFARPNNGTLGVNFGFYSAGTTETVGQLTTAIIQPGAVYTFRAWAQGGGNDVGTVPFQIGYAATTGDLASFVALATQTYVVGNAWEDLAGVTYTTGAAGPEIGKELIVRLGGGAAGGSDDIWFDNFSASFVPEPGSLVLLAAGAGLLLRRRSR